MKVVVIVDRNGFFYVFNCENGDFICGFLFVDKLNWVKGLDEKGWFIYIEENCLGSLV